MHTHSIHVCDNVSCTNHMPLPISVTDERYVTVIKDGELLQIKRHLYQRHDGTNFYLCDACHAAVEMVVRPRR